MNRLNHKILALLCLILVSGCNSSSQPVVLTGTRWLLESLNGRELLDGTAITLKFTEGEISGSSGCNLYFGGYAGSSKDRIEIHEIAHTEMGCSQPLGILEQEEKYILTLQKVIGYRLDGESLEMLGEQGNVLLQYRHLPQFEDNPQLLVGKTWQLIEADGLEGGDLAAFSLRIDDSTFAGATSCRDYEGAYQTDGDSFQITFIRMTTDVDCAQADLITEGEFTTLLERADQYNVSHDRLELYTVRNNRLVFILEPDQ